MIGHKTESIYRRYGIVEQAMLEMGTARLEALQQVAGRLELRLLGQAKAR